MRPFRTPQAKVRPDYGSRYSRLVPTWGLSEELIAVGLEMSRYAVTIRLPMEIDAAHLAHSDLHWRESQKHGIIRGWSRPTRRGHRVSHTRVEQPSTNWR